MRPRYYADYNATTQPGVAATEAMARAMELWGNPSSAHQIGREATEMIEKARRDVAQAAGVETKEVVFTSGGAEANSLVLLGSLFLAREFRLLTSTVEHSSVRGALDFIQGRGGQVKSLKVNGQGELNLSEFQNELDQYRPSLVSLMAANNETGVLFPIAEIAKACAQAQIPLHTDAVQAYGKTEASLWNEADFISLSGHKIYGPKGIGALIVRRGRQIISTHFGGTQELKRRGGTQNTIGIAGFGGACSELLQGDKLGSSSLRDRFEERLLNELDAVSIQGKGAKRVPNTSNVRFTGVTAEVLMPALDLDGVCVSAGSACSSGSITPSHVLLEMGFTPQEAKECIRFSWGRPTTEGEVDTVADLVISHVKRIRARRSAR